MTRDAHIRRGYRHTGWWYALCILAGGMHCAYWLVVCTVHTGWWYALCILAGGMHCAYWLVVCTVHTGWWYALCVTEQLVTKCGHKLNTVTWYIGKLLIFRVFKKTFTLRYNYNK